MKKIFAALALSAVIVSCKNNDEKKPDISQVKAEVNILRFDRDFFNLDTLQAAASLQKLQQQYPSFAQNFFEFYTPIGMHARQGAPLETVVTGYIRSIKPMYDILAKKYSDLSWLEKELSLAFRYTKHYFPSFKQPVVISTVEALSPDDADEIYGTVYFSDTLTISLQMYAGNDFAGYDPRYYFDYLRRRFEPVYITRNAMRTVVNTWFPQKRSLTLINDMIETGRRLYVLDKLLPDTPDEIILGYTKQQYEDCVNKEKVIWSHFLNNQLLYSEEPAINREYVGEGPFTKELGTDSPGNIGAFTGWQIVKKYMKKHSGTSLEQLLNTDPAEIFSEANYKPD